MKTKLGWIIFVFGIAYTITFSLMFLLGGVMPGLKALALQLWIFVAGPWAIWCGWRLSHKRELKHG